MVSPSAAEKLPAFVDKHRNSAAEAPQADPSKSRPGRTRTRAKVEASTADAKPTCPTKQESKQRAVLTPPPASEGSTASPLASSPQLSSGADVATSAAATAERRLSRGGRPQTPGAAPPESRFPGGWFGFGRADQPVVV